MSRPEASFPVSIPLESENWKTADKLLSTKHLLFSGRDDAATRPGKQKDQPGNLRSEQRDSGKRSIQDRDRPMAISRELKSWLDNVIIPSLVRKYLEEREASVRPATCGDTDADLCST